MWVIQSSVEFQVDRENTEANHQFTNHACYSHKNDPSSLQAKKLVLHNDIKARTLMPRI